MAVHQLLCFHCSMLSQAHVVLLLHSMGALQLPGQLWQKVDTD